MEVKSILKLVETGPIPHDWYETSIGDLAVKVGSGVTPTGGSSRYKEYGRPFVRSQNVGWGTLRLDDLAFIDDETHQSFSNSELQKNDVLLNITGASIGRSAVADYRIVGGNVNQHVCIIRTDTARVSARLVNHLLLSKLGQRQIDSFQAGGNRQGLNFGQVRSIKLSLPTAKSEQDAIADALTDADGLIESLKRLLNKKRRIKQGVMQQLLTGEKRLPGFSGEWQTKTLGTICTKIQDGTHFSPKLGGNDFLYVTSKNIGFGRFDISSAERISADEHAKIYSRCDVRRGDLLLTKDGANTGNAAINPLNEPFSLLSSVALLRFDVRAHVAEFFLYQLLSDEGQRRMKELMSGNAITRLTLKKIRDLTVSVAARPEQDAIAAVLSDLDSEIFALEGKLAKARSIKQGMMQQLLTGRIRLREPSSAVSQISRQSHPATDSGKPHNWQINEAVVISVLTKHFGSTQWPLGRKRYTKLSYLLHRHVERRAEGYLKKAAGPYNPSTKYAGPEKIAVQNGYVKKHSRDKYSGFVAANGIVKAEGYFQKWYGDDVISWTEQFKYKPNDELELLATVDMAMEDLRRQGSAIDLASVKQVIRTHPEWEAKLDREIFSDPNIVRAIQECGKLFGETVQGTT